MFTVTINGKKYEFHSQRSLEEILREKHDKYAVAARVDGRVYDLIKVIDYDCVVEPVDLTSEDGVRIYFRTLKFVFIMAVNRLYPNAHIRFMYGISKGQYCEIDGIELDTEKLRAIEEEMRFVIKQNIRFEKQILPREDAIKLYEEKGYNDKAELLKYRPEESVHVFKCNKERNYLYGYMMPSTGYLRGFRLHFHSPGIVIMYPRHEFGGMIPDYEQSVKFDKALWKGEAWGKICGVSNIVELNRKIRSRDIAELVNLSEIRHENEISQMASEIADGIKQSKVVLIAGPSSSGKTTLSRKLKAHLAIKGINAVTMSTDDYYLDRASLVPDESGNIDLENINTIDLKRFNEDILGLINGKPVVTRHFDFNSGTGHDGDELTIGNDECIIVEGIHGLNEALTRQIPRYNKYKIYISALSHINLDEHTPISTTTCRLIRRAVRDNLFRGTEIGQTLDMWQSVRRGEFRWIYPYQEEANYIFNSELTYELAVLKKHVMPLVKTIGKHDKNFIAANKISKIMKYVLDVDDEIVPSTSLLREFIGGSNYK